MAIGVCVYLAPLLPEIRTWSWTWTYLGPLLLEIRTWSWTWAYLGPLLPEIADAALGLLRALRVRGDHPLRVLQLRLAFLLEGELCGGGKWRAMLVSVGPWLRLRSPP